MTEMQEDIMNSMRVSTLPVLVPKMSAVWVAYRNYGYEGKSEPLAAFTSKALAEVYVAGADATQMGNIQIIELIVTHVS